MSRRCSSCLPLIYDEWVSIAPDVWLRVGNQGVRWIFYLGKENFGGFWAPGGWPLSTPLTLPLPLPKAIIVHLHLIFKLRSYPFEYLWQDCYSFKTFNFKPF
jgi:hypothetical protein